MRTIRLDRGALDIGVVGLGCMGMSWGYDELGRDEHASIEVIQRAIDLGCNLIDTADQYGPFVNERLVGRALRGRRDRAVLATKGGLVVDGSLKTYRNGRPDHIRAACEASLQRLGVDHVDLYQLHRIDPSVPVEETWSAMAELVKEGKATSIGLSEASAAEIARAHAIHPVASVQTELSLWSKEPLEDGVLTFCADNGIAFLAYAPLGRGFLSGLISAPGDLPKVDGRHRTPRFQADAIEANQAVINPVREASRQLGISVARTALAWVLAQGEHVVAIPGTKTLRYLEDNVQAADVELPADMVERLHGLPAPVGTRY